MITLCSCKMLTWQHQRLCKHAIEIRANTLFLIYCFLFYLKRDFGNGENRNILVKRDFRNTDEKTLNHFCSCSRSHNIPSCLCIVLVFPTNTKIVQVKTEYGTGRTRFFPSVFISSPLLSHPVLEGKPNANHVRVRISYSRTQQLHNMDIITQCSK